MMEKIEIYQATLADVEIIQSLAFDIWPVAYAQILSPNQLQYMLDTFYATPVLECEMNRGVCFFIATRNKLPIGFAACAVVPEDFRLFKLHKLYVQPKSQNNGVGKLLLNRVIDDAARKGASRLQLQVNRKNNAVRFYKKMGFTIVKEADFDIGNGYFMNDFVMERILNEMR